MAWTSITNAAVAAGASITTALMTALRDNVSALAAADTGAPKIVVSALAPVTPLLIETADTGTGDETLQFNGLDSLLVRIDANLANTGAGGTVVGRIRLSDDGGSTWTGWSTITGTLSNGDDGVFLTGYVNLATGEVSTLERRNTVETTIAGGPFNSMQLQADGQAGTREPRISAMVLPIRNGTV